MVGLNYLNWLTLICILDLTFIHYPALSWEIPQCDPVLAWESGKSSSSVGNSQEKRSRGDTLTPIMSPVRCSHLCNIEFVWIIYEWLSLQMNNIINWGFNFLINIFDLCGGYLKPHISRIIIFQSKCACFKPHLASSHFVFANYKILFEGSICLENIC